MAPLDGGGGRPWPEEVLCGGGDIPTPAPVLDFHSSSFGLALDLGKGCVGSTMLLALPLRG